MTTHPQAANDSGTLRAYRVSIKRGSVVLRSFEAMAVDAVACTCQHIDLCGDGEKLDVQALQTLHDVPADDITNPNSRAYLRALADQIDANRRDPLMQNLY